jgi:hypothetical protein
MNQARLDLSSARILIDTNPIGAFMLAYDATRKALTAILANQGLRPIASEGGHAVLLDVVLAQLDPPLGDDLREFDWMRRQERAGWCRRLRRWLDSTAKTSAPLPEVS